jgi:predicted peroxiredoxin
MSEKMLILVTHGTNAPELATIPFVMATAAQASDVEVVMGFQGDGVTLLKKGAVDSITAPSFTPLKTLLDTYIEAGGKLLACGPCVKSRGINPETDFVKNATVVNAATFVKESTESKSTLVY